ncbi:phage tail family protein [Corynebacterium coyleae]|uniref:phage tail family protein n=1 Tax=Corynebacterium coyleae TaxID=53374 RepID=UPI001CCD3BEA|nr:phage tail family protein [Corynebacterium coyleae]UBI10055.1 phage tail family protein [Corynebacterium coyleae]
MEARIEIRKLKDDLTVDPSQPRFEIAGENEGNLHVHLATELSGLADPVVEANTKSPGGRPGQRLLSTRFTERNIVFRVTILGDPDNIYRRESAWRSAWSYTSYTEMAYTVNGYTSVIRLRLEDYELDTSHDPAVQGAVDVVMSVVADDPFWYERDSLQFFELGRQILRPLDVMHGPVFPVFRISGVSGSGNIIVEAIQPDGSGRGFRLPTPELRSDATYIVDTDPGARQWQSVEDPNVWNRMNGVRYRLEGTESATQMRIASTFNQGVEVQVAIPFLRPWRY